MLHTVLGKILTEHVPLPAEGKKNPPQNPIPKYTPPFFFPSLHFYSCNKKRLFMNSVSHDLNQGNIISECNGEPNELLRVYRVRIGTVKGGRGFQTLQHIDTPLLAINTGPRLVFVTIL